MKWFRSNIKHGSRLALLALAIQFVLAFGHHHGAAARAASSVSMRANDAGGTEADKTLAARDASLSDPANASAAEPAEPASNQDRDSDHCAVCAVITLARTALLTGPPVLLLPKAYHVLHLTTETEFNHLQSRRVVFQPRAPPSS